MSNPMSKSFGYKVIVSKLTALFLLTLVSVLFNDHWANAQSSNSYYDNIMNHTAINNSTVTQDARSGNNYYTVTNSDGSTSTTGMNRQTGSMWRSQTQPNGYQSGTDSNGNPWQNNGNR